MTNEILTQEEFEQAFNGMGYDRLGTCEMQIKGSHAAALARIAELEAAQRWNSPSERPKNDEDIYWMEREFEARNGTIIRDGYYNEMTDAAYCINDSIPPSKIEWSSVLGWLRYTDLQDSFPETLLEEMKNG